VVPVLAQLSDRTVVVLNYTLVELMSPFERMDVLNARSRPSDRPLLASGWTIRKGHGVRRLTGDRCGVSRNFGRDPVPDGGDLRYRCTWGSRPAVRLRPLELKSRHREWYRGCTVRAGSQRRSI